MSYDIERLIKDLEVEFLCGGDGFTPNDIQELIDLNNFDRTYIEQRLIDRFEEINREFEDKEGYLLAYDDFIEEQLDIWVRK